MGRSEHREVDNILLINYAYRLLSAEAASRVTDAIQRDEKVEVQYKMILQLLGENPSIDPEILLKKIERAGGNNLHAKKPAILITQKWLAAAAIVLIISTVSFYYYASNHSPERLAMELIQAKDPSPYNNATRGGEGSDSAMDWEDMFAKNEFSSVISLLEKENNKSEKQQFFLALAYLKAPEPKPEKAGALLIPLVKSENEFTSDAWLYLGLTQTLMNQNEQAIASLQHVEQTAQVKELEDRLRK